MENRAIPEVVSQYAEEAAFFWLLRGVAASQPHFSLAKLAELDERVEAHLDGLRIAGPAGWEVCKQVLGQGTGEVFVGAILAFESADDQRIQKVLEGGTTSPRHVRALVSALAWLPYSQVGSAIKAFLGSGVPVQQRVGLAASALHRQTPRAALSDALNSADLPLKARALRAVGELGAVDFAAVLRKNLAAEDETCRFWAAWSAALLFPDKDALTALQRIVQSNSPFRERAVQVGLGRMELEAGVSWQIKLAGNPQSTRLAVVAGGVLGDPEGIPWLIQQMKIPSLARVAGEAFSMVTGLDLHVEQLTAPRPEGFESGPTENPADENVNLDADENLPWPNPEAIQRWWDSHHGGFSKGTRFFLGKPISVDWLNQVLRTGRQRQRAAAALELAIRQRGTHLFEVRAPGFRQLQLLEVENRT
jgi:uncharacterized protein (TIGR02270 family)